MATHADISPGKTLERKVTLLMVSLGSNNNKFYNIYYYTDGTAQGKNGRVGEPGTWQKPLSHREANLLLDEKHRKGYREVDVVEDGAPVAAAVTAGYGVHNAVRPTVSSQTFEETIVEHLAGSNQVLERLLRVVVRANRHALAKHLGIEEDRGGVQSNAGGMRYNVQTGQWSTPLGIVRPATVAQARSVLNEITGYVGRGTTNDPQFTRLVNEYMMLIPQAIGRARTTATAVLGDNAAINKQIALLDGLEASVQLSTPAAVDATPSAKPKPKFEVELSLASAAELTTWQQHYYDGSAMAAKSDSGHRSRQGWKIGNLYKINIRPMTVAYDALRAQEMQHPAMALWHSTSIGNVLSILTRGFMIPSSVSNGWAFGPGIYFSDVGTKSTNYCEGDPSFSYICQVNLGRTYELLDWGSSATPQPVKSGQYDTTWAVGKTHLESLGRSTANHRGVAHNEMIVYRPDRVKPAYLVEWAKGSSRW